MSPARTSAGAVLVTPSPAAMVWHEPGRSHESIAVPGVELRPGEALVEVELATVCGSDVHTVLGHRRQPAPGVLGHEQVGRVVALGPGGASSVDGAVLALGDRVVWTVTASCGACERCLRGLPQKCHELRKYGHERLERGWELSGGFATHVHLLRGTGIVRVPETMPAELAAPASCSTATAVAALDAGGGAPLDGAEVLVAGAGMIGLAVTAIASAAGATVTVVDPDVARRETARRFGARAVLDPSGGALAGQLAGHGRGAPVLSVEASGAAASVRALLETSDVGGTVVLVGSVSPGPSVELDPERLVRRLLTVRGVHNYAPTHLQGAIDFLAATPGPFAAEQLVGARFPLDALDEALVAAAAGTHVRVAVDPHAH
ncbi:zinc-binding dehydrogenase [Agromyces soli]|uniref:alcohol dehydrogenase n=1 Tax=Agromyces soli TaxID=659012 RepID=A0ABY4B0B7_9MICO|nr:zinc-binding dehydrogenase [Agromyces soli]UOE27456.1 zinc-binding dehydrogenase [Agromyces soli]